MGNLLFVVGSVLFLWSSAEQTGVWFFIVGSSGMFIGAVGNAVVRLDRRAAAAVGPVPEG